MEGIWRVVIKNGLRRNLLSPWYHLVGDRGIEPLTSSVSRKRSTSELITRQEGILQELLAFVKFLFVIPFSPSPSESHWENLLGFIGIQDCEGQAFFITKKV